ncbi:MAG: nickel pincer cofactor biosynthesis protein LarB [Chthoniobacterales bacterium]|nr:nickel pincer cofactor biosynthesis protein LarB [Chthoniobacterales bacterium]
MISPTEHQPPTPLPNDRERFLVLEHSLPDLSRASRCGRPEAIFCPGKKIEQIIQIAQSLYCENGYCLCTRLDPDSAKQILPHFSNSLYNSSARLLLIGTPPQPLAKLKVGVVSAGTADQAVADEAAAILNFYGWEVIRFADIGIAGIHRLIASLDLLRSCDTLVVVAGMEGALPAAVLGLVHVPVIAVPTSIGYGAHFGGLAPLLTMLNSCAAGLVVVNIDNGFGAAAAADSILRLVASKTQHPCNG